MTTQAAFPSLYPKLQFDAVKSFEPVTLVAVSPLVAAVNSSFPAKTLQDFIAYARANPGKVNFGSSGTGSPIHLAGELFRSMANIDMAHVVYKGISPAITALMGNEIQILFPAIFFAKPYVNNGRLRALGVTSLKRSELVPGWPAIAEFGMASWRLPEQIEQSFPVCIGKLCRYCRYPKSNRPFQCKVPNSWAARPKSLPPCCRGMWSGWGSWARKEESDWINEQPLRRLRGRSCLLLHAS